VGDFVAFLTAATALFVAVGAFVLNYLRGRAAEKSADRAAAAAEASILVAAAAKLAAEESKAEVIKVGDKVYELGKAVDGRLSKLLALTEAAALDRGRLEGAATEKARQEDATGAAAKNDPWTGES
jgi:hypothetical protein